MGSVVDQPVHPVPIVFVAAQTIHFGVTMGLETYSLTHAQLLSTVDAAEIDYPLAAVADWTDFVEKSPVSGSISVDEVKGA